VEIDHLVPSVPAERVDGEKSKTYRRRRELDGAGDESTRGSRHAWPAVPPVRERRHEQDGEHIQGEDGRDQNLNGMPCVRFFGAAAGAVVVSTSCSFTDGAPGSFVTLAPRCLRLLSEPRSLLVGFVHLGQRNLAISRQHAMGSSDGADP